MGFTGSFVRATTVNTDKPARENWGTGVDPRHADASMGDDQGFPALENPKLSRVPSGVVDTYDPLAINADPNTRPQEQEPKGHQGTGPAPRTSNKYDEIKSDTAKHQKSFGASLKNSAAMVMRSITQSFASPRVESLPPATDDNSANASGEARRALRGFNSLALNNPGSPTVNYSGDYIRRGFELFRWTNREMPLKKLTHDRRPIYLNTASTAHVTTAPQGGKYSPYSTLYPSVGHPTAGTARPMMRREPRPWDESAMTDGTETMYAADASQFNAWGL